MLPRGLKISFMKYCNTRHAQSVLEYTFYFFNILGEKTIQTMKNPYKLPVNPYRRRFIHAHTEEFYEEHIGAVSLKKIIKKYDIKY